MKQLIILLMLITSLIIASKNEEKCKNAYQYTYNIMINSPEIKKALANPKLSETINQSIKDDLEKDKEKCIKEFNISEYKCIVNSATLNEINRCKSGKVEKIVVITQQKEEKKVEDNKKTIEVQEKKENKQDIAAEYKIKEKKCIKAMNHAIDITLNKDPRLKGALDNPTVKNSIKSSIKIRMLQQVPNCVKTFDESEYQCIMSASSMSRIKSCKK